LPAFTAGLVEDVTKRVGVKVRLLATVCAGLIFSTMTGYHITQVGIPVIDSFFALWLPSLLFTAFAIGGIANAINIIDGVNGLASGASIIILTAFALLAWKVGDLEILGVCLISIGALAGFFLLNFPLGRIFLGDAGAYATGFVLAVVAVALPERNSEISPLIGLLALSYPVTETFVSIHRRMVREGTNPGQPDRLHLHSLIYRSRARRLAQALGAPTLRNALTGAMVLALPLASSMMAVVFYDETPMIALCIVLIAILYLVTYRKVALLSSLSQAARHAVQARA
jgi:UDP-N-acetylmuramyl pentapeptide phosphotransferase/UDP-N-acetylglucosamine-1-phosphate transferase